MLRIDDLGLARAEAEERGVEHDRRRRAPPRPSRSRDRRAASGSTPAAQQLLVAEAAGSTSTPSRRLRQSSSTFRAPGKAAGHADDGDRLALTPARRRRQPRASVGATATGSSTAGARNRESARTVGYWKRSTTDDVAPDRVLQAVLHPQERQRVAAEVEEVVVEADLARRRSTCAPDRGDLRRSRLRAAAPTTALPRRDRRSPARAGRRGRPCRWPVSGSASSDTNAAGTMYSGSRLRRRARAARRGSSSAPGAPDDVGDEPLVAGPCPRAPRPRRPRTAGWARARASISPSSTRKPRILTWSSMRPRNSMAPSGR